MTDKQATARKVSAGIEFHGRKMDFGFKFEDLPRYWYGNDAFKSTLMNALSCLFLEGERLLSMRFVTTNTMLKMNTSKRR